ncbi:MAG: hypothetical protein Q8Q33_06595 [Chlamydiota bacterium]|nr:hypothetical protein [Chlamydiota bacterium]
MKKLYAIPFVTALLMGAVLGILYLMIDPADAETHASLHFVLSLLGYFPWNASNELFHLSFVPSLAYNENGQLNFIPPIIFAIVNWFILGIFFVVIVKLIDGIASFVNNRSK